MGQIASPKNRRFGLVIPLYRSPHLLKALEINLRERALELKGLSATVLFINDSPDDTELREALTIAAQNLASVLDVKILENESNKGFVRSANRGLQWCLENNADALLLNSDALLADNCVSELQRISRIDPMIGIVCPRSNNATICSLPFRWAKKRLPFEEAHAAFQRLSEHLPDWQFAPTGVGFCMYIRHVILAEFGLLDEVYSPGYHEENDFCCRVNRCGFRVALANRAFCYHDESVSFGSKRKLALNSRNEAILHKRYPEYQRAVGEYLDGPEFGLEQTLTALVERSSGLPRLLIDLTHFRSAHNGTYEYGKKLVRALLDMRPAEFDMYLMCGDAEARYHNLETEFPEAKLVSSTTDEVFDIGLKPAQPFDFEDLTRLSRRALLNFYAMLDTIALDCAYIRSPELSALWRRTAQYSDGLIFISQFSQDQFTRRFQPSARTVLLSALCSTDVKDYSADGAACEASASSDPFILVLGNHYEHKFIDPTVAALVRETQGASIRVLGNCTVKSPKVQVVRSGQLSPSAVDELYRQAQFIVFPSLYEGFGFPLLHGLAQGKVVCARDSALNREIIQEWNGDGSLVLYQDTTELLKIVKCLRDQGVSALTELGITVVHGNSNKKHGWGQVAKQISSAMIEAYQRSPVSPLMRERAETFMGLGEISHGAALAAQRKLFSEIVASPSFKIGKALTSLVGKIPGIRPAYRLMVRG